ncbi:hypothetical protein SISSUDRAFT_683819 [Sistotremastrum suecicum HHB10207 ss-3]|uniref:Uncharacterized protein n=1 Tax=Sistotremastrum suecicum HHB10207 ss-3 TaxID=1314776 RepID=A0A166I1C3_9AGAM|nr:hypothetical protein SISSUDRAFT_683819 [Sistotremastrum suecicum HHB10207 ss-3]
MPNEACCQRSEFKFELDSPIMQRSRCYRVYPIQSHKSQMQHPSDSYSSSYQPELGYYSLARVDVSILPTCDLELHPPNCYHGRPLDEPRRTFFCSGSSDCPASPRKTHDDKLLRNAEASYVYSGDLHSMPGSKKVPALLPASLRRRQGRKDQRPQ